MSPVQSRPLVGPLLGATVLVADPERAAGAFQAVLGWRRRAAGRIGDAAFVTVGAPGSTRGMVRFLEGDEGRPVEDLREGWASIEVVVRDVDGLARRIAASDDFRIRTEPVTFDLTEHGSNVHRALVAWGPGGLMVACTMAVTQPWGRRFPEAGADVGPVFSVGLRTPDLHRTSQVYERGLGMQRLLEVSWRSGQWHRMWNVREGEEAALRLLKGKGEGTGLGTIEVQSFPPAQIGPPLPPGIAWVTYATPSVEAARAAAEQAGVAVVVANERACTLVGGVGERLEVLEGTW